MHGLVWPRYIIFTLNLNSLSYRTPQITATYTECAHDTVTRCVTSRLNDRSPYANLISVTTSTASLTVSAGASLDDDNARLLYPPFMECSVDELSIGEVRELLSECRRLVEGVRELDRFYTE